MAWSWRSWALLITLTIIAAIVLDIYFFGGSQSSTAMKTTTIHLRTGHLAPLATFDGEPHPLSFFTDMSITERMDSPQATLFLVQFNGDRRDAARQQIESIVGRPMLNYVPVNTFAVCMTHAMAQTISKLPDVIWVGNARPNHKISPNLFSIEGQRALIVRLTYDANSTKVAARLANKVNGTIAMINSNRLMITMSASRAGEIADDPDVMWIEMKEDAKWMNRYARGAVQNGLSVSADYASRKGLIAWDNGLQGDGQVIGLGDSGIDTTNCFFSDGAGVVPFKTYHPDPTAADFVPDLDGKARKIIQYVTFADNRDDLNGHGTHVSGSAVGQPEVSDPTLLEYQGMAPNSKIAFFDIGLPDESLNVPDDLNPYFQWAYIAGARIHSNSWGTSSPLYTTASNDMDTFMYNNKDFLIVVAAGNDGSCNAEMTIGAPATAKSIITIGSTMSNIDSYAKSGVPPPLFNDFPPNLFDENNIALFSSRGPMQDARIKPDLVAPGFSIVSARVTSRNSQPTCGQPLRSILSSKSGTSMSTPIVAAAITIIRQYLIDGFYPTGKRNTSNSIHPSGSLLKATAIAGGVPISGFRLVTDKFLNGSPNECPNPQFVTINKSPGIDQGWGRLELDTVLEFRTPTTSSLFFYYILGMDFKNADKVTFGDPSISQGQTHLYQMCILPIDGGVPTTSISLVWTDPPASLLSGTQLVNNLDLEVTYQLSPSGSFVGNQGAYKVVGPDTRNPVEVVKLQNPVMSAGPQDVRIFVHGRSINVGGPQYYSLVVTGLARAQSCAQIAAQGGPKDDKAAFMPIVQSATPQPVGALDTARIFTILIIIVAVLAFIIILISIIGCYRNSRSEAAPAAQPQSVEYGNLPLQRA